MTTKSVAKVIHEMEACWLMDELIKRIRSLHMEGLHLKACVCDHQPTNVFAYRKLFALSRKYEKVLRFYIEGEPTYKFYGAEHFFKNIRRNLIHQKNCYFLSFRAMICERKQLRLKAMNFHCPCFPQSRRRIWSAKRTCQPR